MPLTRFEEYWPLPTESLPELPQNLNIVFLVDYLSSGNPVHVDHASAFKKRDHQKFAGGFALSGLLGSGRASMLPLGTLPLGLWVIAEDLAFIASHQRIKNCAIWIDQLDHLPAVMTMFFFLIFPEYPWDKLRANLPHLQFLANNYAYSSHTDIKLCTYCLYRHKTVLIHEILYLANQLWCIDFLTPPTPLIIPQRLPAFLESLMPLKNWCLIHARWPKSSLKHSIHFCGIFSKFKTILLHIVLLKCPLIQIAFLKFTSCDNQALVECIPIAAVAVHLNLKS